MLFPFEYRQANVAPSEILFSHKFFSTHFAIDYPYIDIFSSRGRKSLLNCMCCRLKMYSCGNVSSLLTCSRVNVYWALTYSRASVSCVLTHLRALRAYTSTFFVCLRAHVSTCLASSRPLVPAFLESLASHRCLIV